ncbi:MAG: hypothetical protein RBR59_08690 [Sulfurimonadaceae bacterium]|jgi:predicted Zn-dependent protease|nr:hypothetical protein [Sulfurimonadaceae bacterium]
MFKIFSFVAIIVFFAGCSATSEPKAPSNAVKAFDEEDTYILFALRAEQMQEHGAATNIFETLYAKSDKKEYFYRSLQNAIVAQKNEYVIEKIDGMLQGELNDFILVRLKILALMAQEKLEEAKDLGIALIALTQEDNDYVLVSDIYIKQKKFDTAIKYLESAYAKSYSEEVLDKISIIFYVNLQRPKEAIAQLETHTRIHGCSELICARLIGFYSNDNNIDGLLETYLRLYETFKSDDAARNIIQIYAYKKEYDKLELFLEESSKDDYLLLQSYIKSKKFKKAAALSYELYEQTLDVHYLAQHAIYRYEALTNKNDKKAIKEVVATLKEVIEKEKNATYYNYLGYLMIDHAIDIKTGMTYVRYALKDEPKSAYYLDSLAWGYYKLGNCKKAKAILDEVKNLEGGNDPEVLKHMKKVNECINKTIKGKKK